MDKRLRFMTDLIAPLKVPPGSAACIHSTRLASGERLNDMWQFFALGPVREPRKLHADSIRHAEPRLRRAAGAAGPEEGRTCLYLAAVRGSG